MYRLILAFLVIYYFLKEISQMCDVPETEYSCILSTYYMNINTVLIVKKSRCS